MRPTLKDIAESQREVLDELGQLRDRVAKMEGVCDHCTSLQAGEAAALKSDRRGNGGESRVILAFLTKHWKGMATFAGFAYLWLKNNGSSVDSDQLKHLQEAVDFLSHTW